MNFANLRVGIGYDVHPFAEGGALRLGGIDVPSTVHLVGHSDADTLAHALTDALLGAAGLGDIGEHFPPADPSLRGIDSMLLLRKVLELIQQKGFTLINADTTILAETPKLGEYKKAMAKTLAKVLALPEECVNVKATTNEGMGFVGRREGLSAMAVVLLCRTNLPTPTQGKECGEELRKFQHG
jgi:2-C-methyl-D-erythritol 2,4-cyclodiphosphate synthase